MENKNRHGATDLNSTRPRPLPTVARTAWFLSILLVSYLSLIPRIEIPYEFSGMDKAFHFLAYLWLAVLPFFGFKPFKMAITGALLMVPLGIGLEFAQGFVPGRFLSVADMIADSAGVASGLLLGSYLKSFHKS